MNGRRLRMNVLAGLIALIPLGLQALWPADMFYEPDPTAYRMMGRQLAQGQAPWFSADDPYRFHEHMWVERNGRLYSKYPPGYPVLLALAEKIGGEASFPWVSPILGAVGLWATWLLLRRLAPPGWALAALLYLSFSPLAALFFRYPLPHAASFAAVAIALVLLWRWWERDSWPAAFGAGLALGAVVWIRYPDAIIALPAAWIIVCRLRGLRPGDPAAPPPPAPVRAAWPGVLWLVLGGGLAVLPLMAYQQICFGRPWITGYMLSGEQTAFRAAYLLPNLQVLLRHMNSDALFLAFPLALAGLLWLVRSRRAEGSVLWVWTLGFLIFYSSFYWTVPMGLGVARFQIPALPVYGAGLAVLLAEIGRGGRWRWMGALALLAVGLAMNGLAFWGFQAERDERPMLNTLAAAQSLLPANAVVLAENNLEDALHGLRRYTVYRLRIFHPNYLKPDHSDYARGLDPRIPWAPRRQADRQERLRKMFSKPAPELAADLRALCRRQLAAGRPVYLVGDGPMMPHYVKMLAPDLRAEKKPWPPAGFEARKLYATEVYRVTAAE